LSKIIQVLGQRELTDWIASGNSTPSHLISIANPFVNRPQIFRQHFDEVLELNFFDAESVAGITRRFPTIPEQYKILPRKEDVLAIADFIVKTKARSSGYTIHCHSGVARSTATALIVIYMLCGSEEMAARMLMKLRPQAIPHRSMVRYFDELAGTDLSKYRKVIFDYQARRLVNGKYRKKRSPRILVIEGEVIRIEKPNIQ
jgi:predicted protein tyrosine phosphatase